MFALKCGILLFQESNFLVFVFVLLTDRFKVAGPDGSLYTVSHDDELGSDDEP